MASASHQETNLNLQDYYQSRFGLNPYALLDFFAGEIDNAAREVGIDWQATRGRITLQTSKSDKKNRYKATALDDARDGHRVIVFADLQYTSQDNLPVPFLTFYNAGGAGQRSTWAGVTSLVALWRRERGILPDPQKLAEERQQQEKRRKADEARAKEKAKADARTAALKEKVQTGYLKAYETARPENGTFPYLQQKKIEDIASMVSNLKRMNDSDVLARLDVPKSFKNNKKNGDFVAVPVQNINGEIVGLQRLYKNRKSYVWGTPKKDNFYVFGDIENAEEWYLVEGFATGASIHLATTMPVVVTFDADNMKKIADLFTKYRPDLPKPILGIDNDWAKPHAGNAGFRTGLEISTQIPEIKIHYPPFNQPEIQHEGGYLEWEKAPTDFNDYHQIFGLQDLHDLLTIRGRVGSLKPEKSAFKRRLQMMRYLGEDAAKVQKAAMQALSSGMNLCPGKLSAKEIFQTVLDACPVQIDEGELWKRLMFLIKAKRQEVNDARGFSQEIKQHPLVNYIKIPAVVGDHGEPLVPPTLVDMINNATGTVILKAPMGSGKTERIIKPVMEKARSAAYFAHRISLIADACNRLNIHNYQDMAKGMAPYLSKIGCCINSITSKNFATLPGETWFDSLETLCIDEVRQVLTHISGNAIQGAVKVTDRLINSVRGAKRVLMCDADANDLVVNFALAARPNETITIYEVTGPIQPMNIVHTSPSAANFKAVQAILDGKKIMVATDGKNSAENLATNLKGVGANVLLVHADNKGEADNIPFLQDPNSEIHKYDAIVYTPTVSSGVSIVTPHFDLHFGIFHSVVEPFDAYQMMKRDRTATDFILGLGKLNRYYQADPAKIFQDMLKTDQITLDALNFSPADGLIQMRHTRSYYDLLKISATARRNDAINNFTNYLLIMLAEDGHNVESMGDPRAMEEKIKPLRKEAAEVNFARRCSLISEARDLTDKGFQHINNKDNRTETDSAALARYQIKTQFCVEEPDPETIALYDSKFLINILNYELLIASEEQARNYDRAQISHRVALTRHNHKFMKWRILNFVFDTLGLTIDETGVDLEHRFSHAQCRQVMDTLLADQDAISVYNHLRLGSTVNEYRMPKDPTVFVQNILRRCGLETMKIKSNGRNYHQIEPESAERIKFYIDRRREKGVSSLEFKAPDMPYQALRPHRLLPANDAQNTKKPNPFNALWFGDTLGDHINNSNSESGTAPARPGIRNGKGLVLEAARRLGVAFDKAKHHLSPADWAWLRSGDIGIDDFTRWLGVEIFGDTLVVEAAARLARFRQVTVETVLQHLTPAEKDRIRSGAVNEDQLNQLMEGRLQ